MKWYLKCWRQYADFSGRARRQEFWMFTLFNELVHLLFGVLFVALPLLFGVGTFAGVQLSEGAGTNYLSEYPVVPESSSCYSSTVFFIGVFISIIWLLYLLATIIPRLAVAVRRLHDTGNSGWMLLVGLIPLVGSIWLLVLYCQDSQPGPNAWGENPKA